MRKRKTKSYKDDLLADLKDLDYAATYLSTALSDSKEVFLLALRDVAEAQKGISKLAVEAQVNRENLYRMLSEQGNPRLDTLKAVLRGVGLRIEFHPERLARRQSIAARVATRHQLGQRPRGHFSSAY